MRTVAFGFMASTRSVMRSAFEPPMVLVSAWIWRFMLVMQTLSKSTSVSWPMPVRARASAA